MKLLRDLILIKQEDAVTEKKTESGLILLSTQSNLYQIGDDESKVKDLIYRPKMNKGEILEVGNGCSFFKKGDTVIYRKETESYILDKNLMFNKIQMPYGSTILSTQNQNDEIVVWAEVDTEARMENIEFISVFTGTNISSIERIRENYVRSYIGTVQIKSLVWHIFKLIKYEPTIKDINATELIYV